MALMLVICLVGVIISYTATNFAQVLAGRMIVNVSPNLSIICADIRDHGILFPFTSIIDANSEQPSDVHWHGGLAGSHVSSRDCTCPDSWRCRQLIRLQSRLRELHHVMRHIRDKQDYHRHVLENPCGRNVHHSQYRPIVGLDDPRKS